MRPWRLCPVLLALVALALLAQEARAISYTVQVIAVSDQDTALSLQKELVDKGYPAYLVRVPGGGSTFYRVRVGAFADRDAAVNFARALKKSEGDAPVPALAEGIPLGLFPLEPDLVASYPYAPSSSQLTVIPWGEGRALRFQEHATGGPAEAQYRILSPDVAGQPFTAWRAAPAQDDQEGLVNRVYELNLYPDDAGEQSQAQLQSYAERLEAAVAKSLGLTTGQLRPYEFTRSASGLPYLVLAERFNPQTGERQRLPALGNPEGQTASAAGPELTWFDQAPPAGFPRRLVGQLFTPEKILGSHPETGEAAQSDPESLVGDGWTASADGGYTRVTLADSDKSWRIVAGYPLLAYHSFLLVYDQQKILLYSLIEPQS